jgi:hypothetical protein
MHSEMTAPAEPPRKAASPFASVKAHHFAMRVPDVEASTR